MQLINKPVAAIYLAVAAVVAQADDSAFDFNIPAQPVSQVLDALAKQTGLQPFYAEDSVKGMQSLGVQGRYSLRDAVAKALAGTGLTFQFTAEKSVAIKAMPAPRTDGIKELGRVEVVGAALEKAYTLPNAATGTKTDTPIMETPMNVQVVPQQVLLDQNANTLTDALSNVSGVVSTRSSLGGGPGESLTLRGFAATGAGANLMTDGVRFENSNGLIAMANVESIEVLKGPAAILYGRMEPGGVVNVVTKKPLEQSMHSIEQQVGSWGTHRTRADSTGPVGDNGNLLYRVNLAYDKQGSWREGGVYDQTTLIAPSLLWNISPRTQLALNISHDDSKGNADFQITPFANGQPTVLPWERNLNGPQPFSNKTDSVDVTLNHRFNEDWSIKTKLAHGDNKYFSSAMVADWLFSSGPSWMAGQGLTYVDSSRQNDFVNVDLTGHFDTGGIRHTLLLGADHDRNHGDFVVAYDDFSMSYIPFDVSGSIPNAMLSPDWPNARRVSFSNKQSGLYLQDQVELPNKVFVTAGLRQQKYVTHAVDNQSSSTDRDESKVTPRVGVLWRAQPWLSLYGSYTESFGLGSGNIFPGTPMPATGAKQYEAGVKTETNDGKLRSTLSYFDIAKTNIATRDLTHCPSTGACLWSVPVGEVRSSGVELDIEGEIQPHWSAIFTYAHTDPRITVNNTKPWQVGDKLASVPSSMASLWTTYSFFREGQQGWKIGAGVNWRDAAMSERYNNTAPQQSYTPGYSVVNAMASYAFKSAAGKWTAQVNIDNLLNQKYWSVPQAPAGGVANIVYGDPRSATASLKLEF